MSTSTNRVTAITASAPAGTAAETGTTITFTLSTEARVLVTGSPRLTLSNGAVATYAGSDASNRPTFSYTVGRGDDTTDLKVTGLTLNGGAVTTLGQMSFAPKQDFATGLGPWSLATADVNGDGRLDLITANDGENNVVFTGSGALPALSVLLGNGDGTFAAKQDFAVGRFPRSVAAADVNRDGHLDLITSDGDRNAVSVLLGRGDGTFAPRQNFAIGYDPAFVTAADVNGDGKPDLIAISESPSNLISVLLGNGDGTFAAKNDFATGSVPTTVTAADVNGDGKLDLIANAVVSDAVSVLLGHGDGTFAPHREFPTGAHPWSAAAADVNGDGKLDLIVADSFGGGVSVLLGNGDGTFAAKQEFPTATSPMSVTTGDMNGDGKLDIITANRNSNNVSVLLGNGDGTFAGGQDLATGRYPTSVTAIDVNGDGKLDVLAADYDGNAVSVLLNTSTFSAPFDASAIATVSGADTGIAIHTSGAIFGQLAFRLAAFGLDQGWTSQSTFPRELADLNGDGAADIVGFGKAGVYVSLGAGDGSFGTASFASPSFALDAGGWLSQDRHPRHVGDVNGDGRADIVGFANVGTYVALGDGHGTFGPMTFRGGSFGVNQGWTSDDALPRVLADVNGDGRADVVGFGESAIFVELGQTDGSFGAPVVSQIGLVRSSGWLSDDVYHRELADVNGDGRADIVAFGEAGVFVAMSNGDGSFGGAVFEFADFGRNTWGTENQHPRHVADVNGDGKADMVGFGADRISIALGNGDGTFQATKGDAVELTSQSGGWTSEDSYPRLLADINHDGAADVVGFAGAGVFAALASDYHFV